METMSGCLNDRKGSKLRSGTAAARMNGYPPPHTLRAPSAEAPEHAVPIPEHLGTITPGRTSPHDPKHHFDKHPVAPTGRTLLIRTPDDQWRHPIPGYIAQHQSIDHTQRCLQKTALMMWSPRTDRRHAFGRSPKAGTGAFTMAITKVGLDLAKSVFRRFIRTS